MAATMETDEDAADRLVRGMHPDLLPPLVEFLEKDRRTRLAKRDPADVLRALFTPDELESLLVDAQQLNTSLWQRLWNKARPRRKGLSVMYALYLVDGYVKGPNKASYDAFVAAFAACKFPNHLVDDPQWYSDGSWEIRVAGIGEGLDGQRRWHYFYMPEGELNERQKEYMGESLIKAMQYAAEQTVGVRWGVEFRTLVRFGRNGEYYKKFGLGYEGVLMILAQSYTRGIVFFNMQLGDNRKMRFATLFYYCFKNVGHVEGGYPLKPRSNERETRFAVGEETEEEEEEPVLTDEPEKEAPLEPDYEMPVEAQVVETLIVATDDQVEYDVLVAVAEASVGLPFRFAVMDLVAELIKAAVARKEEPPFAVFDAKQVAGARMVTGLPPCQTYKLLFSSDGRALRAALLSSGLVAPFETLKDNEIEAIHASLRLAAGPPAFVQALRAVHPLWKQASVVFPDAAGVEVLDAVRQSRPSWGRFLAGSVDRFLAALIRRRTTPDGVLEELFEDATDVAAARRETGVQPSYYEWLLDERGAVVRRLLSELGVPCAKNVVTPDDVDDAYAADLLRREPSPLLVALRRLDRGADPGRADDVRVACLSERWKWTGRQGLEPFLEVLLGSLKDGSDELFASASRLAEARRACPGVEPRRLKMLLDAEDDAGMIIRAALRRAGRNVDTLVSWADVEAASVVLNVEETALYQAVVDVGLVRDGTAATIVAMRGLVGSQYKEGLNGVQWGSIDRVLAAALRVAAGRQVAGAGLRLFEVGTLVDALIESEVPMGQVYKFLDLLEDGNDDAREVRVKLADVHLDEGEYTAATRGPVKSALRVAKADARKAEKRKAEEDATAAAAASTSSKRRTRSSPPEG